MLFYPYYLFQKDTRQDMTNNKDKELLKAYSNDVANLKKLETEAMNLRAKMSMRDDEDVVWNMNFELLKEYKEQHKDTLVHKDYKTEDGIPLGVWTKEQRDKFSESLVAYDDPYYGNGRDLLPFARFQKLLDIGFSIDDDAWLKNFKSYRNYMKQSLISLVPANFVTSDNNEQLHPWLSRQRDRYFEGRMTQHEYMILKLNGFLLNTKLEIMALCNHDIEVLSGIVSSTRPEEPKLNNRVIRQFILSNYSEGADVKQMIEANTEMCARFNFDVENFCNMKNRQLLHKIKLINKEIDLHKGGENLLDEVMYQSKILEKEELEKERNSYKRSLMKNSDSLRRNPSKKMLEYYLNEESAFYYEDLLRAPTERELHRFERRGIIVPQRPNKRAHLRRTF